MKRKTKVRKIAAAVAESKQLVRREKKRLKKTRNKIARDNKKRTLKVLKKSLKSLEDQRDVLKAGVPIPVWTQPSPD